VHQVGDQTKVRLNSMLHNKQYMCHNTYCISYWNRFSL